MVSTYLKTGEKQKTTTLLRAWQRLESVAEGSARAIVSEYFEHRPCLFQTILKTILKDQQLQPHCGPAQQSPLPLQAEILKNILETAPKHLQPCLQELQPQLSGLDAQGEPILIQANGWKQF